MLEEPRLREGRRLSLDRRQSLESALQQSQAGVYVKGESGVRCATPSGVLVTPKHAQHGRRRAQDRRQRVHRI